MTSLGNLPYFLTYFVASIVLLAIFLAIYTRVTRHDEWSLMQQGNIAATVSLSGAALGFALPLASVIAHAVSFIDLLVWAVVAMAVQLLSYFLIYAVQPDMTGALERGEMAPALQLATGGVVMGVINAACLTY